MSSVFLELNTSDREAKNVLNNLSKAYYREEYDLYELDENQFKLYPELKRLKQYTEEQARERAEKIKIATQGIKYTADDQLEMNDRVYLDYVPPKYSKWVANPENGFKYDNIAHQYYTTAAIAKISRYRNRILEMQRPHNLSGLDINQGEPTLGKSMLAIALNEKDYAKRQAFIARALVQCAKEKALGIKGAVNGYSEIFKAFDNAGIKLGYKDNYKKAEGYFNALHGFKKISKLKDEEFFKRSAQIEKECLGQCYQEAAHNIQNSIEGNLRNLAKSTNHGQDSMIQQMNKLMSDYAFGAATNANSQLCTNGILTTPYNLYENKFKSDVKKLLSTLKNQISTDDHEKLDRYARFVSQVKTMQEMACKNGQVISSRTNNFIADHKDQELTLEELDEQFNLNNAEASSLLKAYEKQGFSKQRDMGAHEFKLNSKIDLPKNAEPLYIVMDYDERKHLPADLKRKLHSDPYCGALCVVDSPENRKAFAEYMPKQEDLDKMSAYAHTLLDDVAKHLTEEGATVDKSKLLLDDETHQLGALSYKFSTTEAVPKILIFNKNTNEQKEFEVGQESNLKFENFKKDFSKAMQSKNAMTRQSRISTAHAISENFTTDNMKLISETNLDFPYLKQSGISAKEFGGFIDNKGAFDGYAFVNNKEATQTKTTIFMPMYNASGKIINAMAISDNGKEEFIGGAPLKGTFSVPAKYMSSNPRSFAEKLNKAEAILIVEDPKSAAAISKCADSNTVVVSANTLDNMKYVAESLAKQCPRAGVAILSADESMKAATTKVNASVHEAEHTARFVLRDLRPLAKAYKPSFTQTELASGAVTFADEYKISPERMREHIESICLETADNHKISKATHEFEKNEAKKLNEYLKHLNNSIEKTDTNEKQIRNVVESNSDPILKSKKHETKNSQSNSENSIRKATSVRR